MGEVSSNFVRQIGHGKYYTKDDEGRVTYFLNFIPLKYLEKGWRHALQVSFTHFDYGKY